MTIAFRVLAIAIAIAGALDPAWTAPRRTRPPVAIVVNDSPTLALPDGDGAPRRATADKVRDRLRADLRRDFSIESSVTSDTAAAVVIGDEYASVARDIPVATVSIADGIAPNVAIVRVNAPPEVLPATTIPIAVDVDAAGMRGQTTTLRVMSSGVPLATATHTWTSDRDRWRAVLDVPPAGEPPFAFRVEAAPLPGERTAIDNTVDVSVDRRRERLRVLAYDGRPSWAATFLRRALESDPRFDVETLTATSRNIAARTSGAIRLGDASLSTFDAVMVGGLEALTPADLRALDAFMHQRGGGVLAVPDRRIDDRAILEWLQLGPLREQLFEQPDSLTVPQGLPPVRGSELLLVGSLPPLARALARASGGNHAPAIVTMPRGAGRLIYSGALDAWRYRAEDNAAFDRYWQSVVAAVASASARPIEVDVDRSVARPGDLIAVRVRVSPSSGGDVEQRALRASADGQAFRLWPDAERGAFHGEFVARRSGVVRVVVERAGSPPDSASRQLVVRDDARPAAHLSPPLALLASSHRGIDVAPSQLADVEAFVRRTVTPMWNPATTRPMRSPWWIVPFAGCLSAEWYLRRRRGQR